MYKKGFLAGEKNQSLDSCRYTKTRKRIAWMNGYQDGKSAAEARTAKFEVTRDDKEQARALNWINKLKQNVTA